MRRSGRLLAVAADDVVRHGSFLARRGEQAARRARRRLTAAVAWRQGAGMTITYRDAGPDDAAVLAALFEDSFTATFGHLYAPADLAVFLGGFTPARWAAEIGDPAYGFRVAEEDGRAVGYAKLGPAALPVTAIGPAVELRQLYLLPEGQGTGAARVLMDWVIAEARARGAGELFLSVYVDNARARAFYERYGFERVGRYAFMVGAHADEDDLMRLAL